MKSVTSFSSIDVQELTILNYMYNMTYLNENKQDRNIIKLKKIQLEKKPKKFTPLIPIQAINFRHRNCQFYCVDP